MEAFNEFVHSNILSIDFANIAINKVSPILEKDVLMTFITHIISNTYVCNETDTVRQQVIGIPMGTNCGPYIANLTLYVTESQYVDGQNDTEAMKNAHTRRFIDDIITWNTVPPSSEIYGIQWLETTNNDGSVNFLGSTIKPSLNGTFTTSVYDKFEEWPFTVIKYPHISSNVPIHQSSGIIKGQLFRFRIICNCISSFKIATTAMVSHMILRGYDLRHIFKGWASHLAKFHDDRFTHYPRLRMWFKKMINWVVMAKEAGNLFSNNDPRPTQVLLPPSFITPMLRTPPSVTLVSRQLPSVSMPVLHNSDTLSLNIHDPETQTLARSLAGIFETEYLTTTENTTPTDNQIAGYSRMHTSLLYQHLVLYRDFFADGVHLRDVNSIIRAMELRWNKSKREETTLEVECTECHQLFPTVSSCNKHRTIPSSTCGKAQRIHALAIAALKDQRVVQPHAPSPSPSVIDITNDLTTPQNIPVSTLSIAFHDISNMITATHNAAINMEELPLIIVHRIGNIQISVRDMHSLRQEGELVEDNIIDAFQYIALTTYGTHSYYFNLAFFQLLVDINGYSLDNVINWITVDLFQTSFLYFPVVFNAHYILIVADMSNKTIKCYDPLGINRKQIMYFIVRYLSDMFHRRDRGDNETWDMRYRDDYFKSWTLVNVFTTASRIQFNSVDCGIFLMKFVQLLGQNGDISILNQSDVPAYREEMVALFQNFNSI
jgi:hypothetical protein